MLDVYFVLVNPKYPGNVGFVARTIKNFGFKKLVLIDPLFDDYGEARRYAMHAADVIDRAGIYRNLQVFIESVGVDYVLATTAKVGSEKNPLRLAVPSDCIRNFAFPPSKIAVLFGNEESGLKNEHLRLSDIVITIPTSEDYPTMNLSHAVAIIAYELSLALKTFRELPYRPATRLEREIIVQTLFKILDTTFPDMDPGKREIYRGILNNWVRRAFLTGREAHSIIGFLKTIEKALLCAKNPNNAR